MPKNIDFYAQILYHLISRSRRNKYDTLYRVFGSGGVLHAPGSVPHAGNEQGRTEKKLREVQREAQPK